MPSSTHLESVVVRSNKAAAAIVGLSVRAFRDWAKAKGLAPAVKATPQQRVCYSVAALKRAALADCKTP